MGLGELQEIVEDKGGVLWGIGSWRVGHDFVTTTITTH